ncbi:MAG: hypothetical protein K2H86_07865 [Muribaculaceae bacterium]|nr:hypothetical protein [Muribaculaceae bacterium]
MKKKSLLISGLIFLGAAVGVTSYAVSSGAPGISLFADGDEEEVKPVSPTAFNPARGSYHFLSDGMSSAYLEFTGTVTANFSEDTLISLWQDTSTSTAASYKKIAEWPTTDAKVVSLDGNRLVINFALPEGFEYVAAPYYIDVPEGVVLVDGVPSEAFDHNDANKLWSFVLCTPVAPSSEYPAKGSSIGSSLNVQTLNVKFAGLGDAGITNINRAEGENIIVKKGDEVLYTIPTTDTKAITLDGSYPDQANIKLPAPLTEGGVYTVEIPQGLFVVKGLSAAYTWSFTIIEELTPELSMEAGATYPFSAYGEFKITYPEGTTLALTAGKVAKLYHFMTGNASEITSYTASVEGNVVTLKANDLSKMPVASNKNANYLYIVIPEGMYTVTNGAISYAVPAFNCGNYLSTAYGAADFKFIPELGSDATLEQLETITLVIPEGSNYCGNTTPTTVVLVLYPGENTNGFTQYINYTYSGLTNDGKGVICKRATPTSPTSLVNNVEYVQKGMTSLKLNANMVQLTGGTAKNSATSYNNIAYNITDGQAFDAIYNSTPANNSGVTNITSLTLNFVKSVTINNEDAVITLSKNGEVIKSVNVAETTTAAAKVGGNGSASVAFSNLFKIDGAAITEPGIYTYHVPAGAFKQTNSEYLNVETEITTYIVNNVDFEIYPKPATFTGTSKDLVAVPGTEFTELNEFTLTYAEGATIELIEGWKNHLSEGGVGTIAASNLLKDPITASPASLKQTLGNITVDGNKITFALSSPWRGGTPANYGLGLKIPAGLFIVNVAGEDGKVTKSANAQILEYYQGIPMAQGQIGSLSLDAVSGKAVADYLQNEDGEYYTLASNMAEILYTAYEPIYPKATTPEVTLYDEEDNVVTTYTCAAVDGDKYPGISSSSMMMTAADAEKVAALGTSTYKLVIKAGTIQGGSSSATSTLKVLNSSDFVYNINTLETVMTPSVESATTVAELSTITLSFDNVMMATINEDLTPLVYTEETYTEGIYEGDTYNRNITEDGYEVSLRAVGGVAPQADGDDDFGVGGAATPVAELVITPALEKNNTYHVYIPAGAIMLNGVVKSPVVELQYTVEKPVALADALIPGNPELEFTYDEEYTPLGMGQLMLGGAAGVELVAGSEAKAALLYGEETIAEIGIYTEPEVEPETPETPETQADEDEEAGAPIGIIAMPMSEGSAFIFSFANAPEEKFLQGGEYTLVIPDGLFTANGVAVSAGEFVYKMTLPAKEPVEFDKVIAKVTPAGDEITLEDTFMGMGMRSVIISAKEGAVLNKESKATVQLMYMTEDMDAPMVVGTASPAEEIYVFGGNDHGVNPLAEEGETEEPAASETTYLIQFMYDDAMEQLFSMPGMWIVTIPEGVFTVDGAVVTEGSLQYMMTAVAKDYTWTLTPVTNTEFEGKFTGEVVLTVNEATSIDYEGVPAVLADAEGTNVNVKYFGSSYPKLGTNTLTWTFKADVETAIGEYTFTLKKMTVGCDVDLERGAEPNFPAEDIVVTYIVKTDLTGVALIGIEAADSYNVYTLDGKAVLLNANVDAVVELAAGVYIINGKKVIIRK